MLFIEIDCTLWTHATDQPLARISCWQFVMPWTTLGHLTKLKKSPNEHKIWLQELLNTIQAVTLSGKIEPPPPHFHPYDYHCSYITSKFTFLFHRHYRRFILRNLKDVDLKAELAYISQVIEDNLKNYQVWHHRHAVVEMLNDGSQELEFTQRMLEHDEKNYHAWTHRWGAIWILEEYGFSDNQCAICI